jgi:hypothetical protein
VSIDLSHLLEWQEIKVRWRDAYSPHSGWHEIDEYEPKDAVAVTIGRFWKDCQENYLTLVGTVFENDGEPETIGDINHIPLGMILSIEPINKTSEFGVNNG